MQYKYIPFIPKPLLNDFINNRVVPFVGAGFSKNADIPEELSMPDWNELGKLAADEIQNYTYENNAIDALSYYESLYSRTKLIEFLMRVLHVGEIKPGDTYKALCDLFTGTICTTNFDFLLEEAMSFLHRPISTIVTEDRLTINTKNESRILKLHGDFNHPEKMVVSEHDYDMYLENNPIFSTYVSNLFITNTMLLIGYSLDDNDFRGIWQILNNRLGGMAQPAYCIMVNATEERIAKYQRRNIRVVNLAGEFHDYKTILYEFFTELKEYISAEKDKTAKSTDEKINEQMIIPAEDNRLCFISCAMSRIAQLSALLNPILRNAGITPVRIDDMLMPGDNWIGVSRTAIRKSKIAIVDVSDKSSSVSLELGLLISEKDMKNVLIICEEGIEPPFSVNDRSVLRYSFEFANEKIGNKFAKSLTAWITKTTGSRINIQDNKAEGCVFENAHRLFEKKEYSACIVSAFSELEFLFSKKHPEYLVNKYDLSQKLAKTTSKNNFQDDIISFRNIKNYISIRNKIVHEGYIANAMEAKEVINLVELFYSRDLS